MDLCGKVIAKKRMKSVFANDSAYYQSVADNLETFLRDTDADRKKILGVGFSLPGIINKHDNVLVRSHVLKQNHMNLKPFSQRIPFPVSYENDANSALFAETHHIDTDMIYLSLSNSVGGAIYLNGKIFEDVYKRQTQTSALQNKRRNRSKIYHFGQNWGIFIGTVSSFPVQWRVIKKSGNCFKCKCRKSLWRQVPNWFSFKPMWQSAI